MAIWADLTSTQIKSRRNTRFPFGNMSFPWIWKGVSATLQSGRYTLSYPRGRCGPSGAVGNKPLKRWNISVQTIATKGFYQFEISKNVLVSSFRFVWIPMLWVYGHCKYFYSYSARIDFRRQNRRLTSIPALLAYLSSNTLRLQYFIDFYSTVCTVNSRC